MSHQSDNDSIAVLMHNYVDSGKLQHVIEQ